MLLLVAAGPVSSLIGNAAPGVARLVGGNVAVAAVAVAVLGFTLLEIVGLRRLSAA